MSQIILDYTPYYTRVALVDNGELVEFSMENATVRGIVGNIYKGRVKNLISGMKAAFVDIGLEKNGFLQVGDSLVDENRMEGSLPKKQLNVSPGDIIMCQVVKDQFGTKGARLTTEISLPGLLLVLLPFSSYVGISRKIENMDRRAHLEDLANRIRPEGMGFIIRSAANDATDDEIIEDANRLFGLWDIIQKTYTQAQVGTPVFEETSLFNRAVRDTFSLDVDKIIVNDESIANSLKDKIKIPIEVYDGEKNIMSYYHLSDKIYHLCDHRVDAENGVYIVIDKTEALTVIDVNTGKFVGSKDLEDTVYQANLIAARCIAKEVRLRNISGIVIVDFIDMVNPEHQEAVLEELRKALKKDRLKTSTVGMTSLGLVEFTRKKTRLPLDSLILTPCEECNGGYKTSDLQLAFIFRDILVEYIVDHKKEKEFSIGLHKDIYELITKNDILFKRLNGSWKDKDLYFYVDDTIKKESYKIDPIKIDREDMLLLK